MIFILKTRLIKTLADLRFAIIILLMIASLSILGTVIEQNQLIEIYKRNYPLIHPLFGFITWDLVLKLGLNHLYTTWWFLLLVLFFGISLLFCTILQQAPAFKVARRCQFLRKTNQLQKLKLIARKKSIYLNKLIFSINRQNYCLFQQKDIFYCYKGLMGRVTPIIVHFSLITILLGALLSSLIGFTAQEVIPKTEIYNVQNVSHTSKFMQIPKISTRVNDFWINYTNQKIISQFYSNVSLLNQRGNEIKQKTISVNQPVIYHNFDYYQTDWNLIGLRLKTPFLEIKEYPLNKNLNSQERIWLTWIPNNTKLDNGVIVIVNNLQGYCSIYGKNGDFITNLELNENLFSKVLISLIDILSSTGLQIKNDPGIPLTYTGFFFLMISTLISYTTYSQIWIIKKKHQLLIGGITTRAKFYFELQFFQLIQLV